MMVRWKTPESVAVYARTLPSDYADHVDSVTKTDGHRLRGMAHDVTIDPVTGYADIDAAIAELEREGQKRRSASAAPADGVEAEATAEAAAASPSKPTRAAKAAAAAAKKAPQSFDCGEDGCVVVSRTDAAGIVGTTVDIPNSTWPGYEKDNGSTPCLVVGYAARHRAAKATSKGAYVVEADGDFYAFDKKFKVFKRDKRGK